ncbi:MAG TPA: hypothetical protein VNO23_12420, partial [Candidatus Binatia bacterium]|nr:hypothetical protein [Candidatus Binatia bacterium]
MRGVLVLAALDVEVRALARQLGLRPRPGGPGLRFGDGALEIAAVGLRASTLNERVGDGPRPSLVVAAGTCGA